MIPIEFFALSDMIVIGRNPEMADVSNPRGDILGYASYVYGEDIKGYRVRILVKTDRYEEDVMPQAKKMAAALNVRLSNNKLPIGFDTWQQTDPRYGSEAYIE